ncbi:MAG TPA: DUF4386 domain-containing protein [Candidatus Cybelea sp.]|nr:DUF4386 domain-containing protein [Candidatus Cybelea sp.]
MRNRNARFAGWLYLLSVPLGIFTLRYIPDRLVVPNDAVATAHAMATHPTLVRLAIAGDLLTGVFWLAVVLALYELFRDVNRAMANLMVVLGALLQVPFYFFNSVNYAAALLAATGANSFLSAFAEPQRDAIAMLFLKLHAYDVRASLLLAGLWLFPLGVLVYRCGFLPRTIGVWLIVNGVAWLAICFTGFVFPQYGEIVDKVTAPILFGEVVFALWLAIVGARTFGRAARPAT